MPRLTPNLIISIPQYNAPPPQRHHRALKSVVRLLPWIAMCTLVLWLFVLQADKPVLRTYTPTTHSLTGAFRARPFRPTSPNSLPLLTPSKWSDRAASVRAAFLHAYAGYRDNAFPSDELRPVSGGGRDRLNGWSLTTHDALDTMLVMGLSEQFRNGVSVIAQQSYMSNSKGRPPAHVHDTILHHLGSLLSCFAISNEPLCLIRADDLARQLLVAFETPSGFPLSSIDHHKFENEDHVSALSLSQIMSGHLEFKYLAHLTGRGEYYNKTDTIKTKIHAALQSGQASPLSLWDPSTGNPVDVDNSSKGKSPTTYQYMLKQWLLDARADHKSLELYLRTINGIISHALFLTPNRHLLYATDIGSGSPTHTFSHSTCSLPGLLALGVDMLGIKIPLRDRELHLWAAQGLAYTCWRLYTDQATGLGPARVQMEAWTGTSGRGDQNGAWLQHVEKWVEGGKKGNGPPGTLEEVDRVTDELDYWILEEAWELSPEFVESMFVLWRMTKAERWRERAWEVFQSIQTHCRTEYGYATILQVNYNPPALKDSMPSYFLGQTLKYLYLMFSDKDPFPLRSWAFNDRGHPLPVFEWSAWEVEAFNITTKV